MAYLEKYISMNIQLPLQVQSSWYFKYEYIVVLVLFTIDYRILG